MTSEEARGEARAAAEGALEGASAAAPEAPRQAAASRGAGEPYALVTGASSGLGREFARLAAADGWSPILVARSSEKLLELAAQLKSRYNVNALALPADLTLAGAVPSLAGTLEGLGISPGIVVNDAGFGAFGPMISMDRGNCRRMVELNVQALTELSLLFAKQMAARGEGRILNVASTAAFQACPYLGVYGATKAYVLSFTEALAQELRGTGATATAFCPGPTRTNFGAAAGLQADSPFDRYAADAPEVAAAGWRGMLAGKPVVTYGALNRISAFLGSKMPRAIVRPIAAAILKKME